MPTPNDLISHLEAAAEWTQGPPPYSDGRAVLVRLKQADKFQTVGGLEYYGEPVVVVCYGSKMKTTLHPIRVDDEDVECWRELDARNLPLKALAARLRKAEAALNAIASWGEGPKVNGGFDEPGSAATAREYFAALQPEQP